MKWTRRLRDPSFVELIAKVVTLVGVLIPATGALVRWVSFGLEEIPMSGIVATSAPLNELAATGLASLLRPGSLIAAVLFLITLAAAGRTPTVADAAAANREPTATDGGNPTPAPGLWAQWRRRLALGLAIIAAGQGFALFQPLDSPIGPQLAVAYAAGLIGSAELESRRLTFTRTILTTAIFMTGIAIVAGVAYRPPEAVVTMKSGATDRALVVGTRGDFVLLSSCTDRAHLLEARLDAISTMEYVHSSRESLPAPIEMLLGMEPALIGFDMACSTDEPPDAGLRS